VGVGGSDCGGGRGFGGGGGGVVAGNSPDRIVAAREGLRRGWTGKEAEDENERLYLGWGPHNELENYKERMRAFAVKR